MCSSDLPNIHIEDMTDLYVQSLQWPDEKIDGGVFNAGYHNQRVSEIADRVRLIVGDDVKIITTPTDDNRSYHISSDKIRRVLGFEATRSIDDAARDLMHAFAAGRVPRSMEDDRYYNIKRMQNLSLQ